ncbi:probable sodium/potassium/calcium exchanger CG1090 [Chrysoperla carnea]|uniref:probable sodium/potassium/calcium exchanger CG1090 n=1 Tax=Chrysoperla carnea TaxID=189513 RepID=UPI001D08836F|nr:probable sodium/potassium/calcium exchanger CG1090 [Chrysoperla carnea]
MKRTRRHKIYFVSIFVLVYSVINVYSDTKESIKEELSNTLSVSTHEPIHATSEKISESGTTPFTFKSTEKSIKEGDTVSPEEKTTSNSASTTPENVQSTTPTYMTTTFVPTLRPRRENCSPPAIEQFPRPLMGPNARKHGGLILHFIVAIYTFIGLAIVCDEYFVASLDRICEELKLAPDVAGATFMAAGSSAPELATVVIGVFFAKDDIGVSGVIGSAIFNIMFVISVCALCSGTVCYLNWWPLVRDCFFYAISILVMLITIFNEKITWGESLFMLFMYVVYCIVLHFNPQLEKWSQTWSWVPCKKPAPEETGLVSYKNLDEETRKIPSYTQDEETRKVVPAANYAIDPMFDPNAVWDQADQGYPVEPTPIPIAQPIPEPVPDPEQQKQVTAQPGPGTVGPAYYKPKEYIPEDHVSPLIRPEDMSFFTQASWGIVYPIHYMCMATMPNCKTEKYKNWYPFTFFISMIWISFYSYFMVWMITIIGSTLGIPDTVMGLTFIAAGVSVPDALSSIAVIKEGYGDMAVSNAVGSNVFDILICLGLPWFIQTAIIKPGSHVNVISKGLTYSTLSLLSTVVFLVVATHLNGWKLDRRLGVILMLWYLIFIVFASLYELNVFGNLNPPECPSAY